jgi:hypothetical protein
MSAYDTTSLNRVQEFESAAAVPTLSTQLLATADGDLNRELHAFMFDPPRTQDLDLFHAIGAADGVSPSAAPMAWKRSRSWVRGAG